MQKLVYDVIDVQKMLGLGKNQTYNLVKANVFPVRQIGNKYLIPKEPFLKWLNGTA